MKVKGKPSSLSGRAAVTAAAARHYSGFWSSRQDSELLPRLKSACEGRSHNLGLFVVRTPFRLISGPSGAPGLLPLTSNYLNVFHLSLGDSSPATGIETPPLLLFVCDGAFK